MSLARLVSNKRSAWITFVLLGILLAFLPFLVDAGLGRTWVRILNFTLLYMMLALGLNIVVGYAGLLDLGYIAFYAVGAYLYALLASPQFGLHLPFWLLLPLGALVAGLFGLMLGAPTLRLRGDYLAIVTLGFGEIVRIFMNNLNAPVNITNGPQGISLIDPISIAGVSLGQTHTFAGIEFSSAHHVEQGEIKNTHPGAAKACIDQEWQGGEQNSQQNKGNPGRAFVAHEACQAHARSPTRSPSKPDGRTTNTRIKTKKANTSW